MPDDSLDLDFDSPDPEPCASSRLAGSAWKTWLQHPDPISIRRELRKWQACARELSGIVDLPGENDFEIDCFDSDHLDLVEIDFVKY